MHNFSAFLTPRRFRFFVIMLESVEKHLSMPALVAGSFISCWAKVEKDLEIPGQDDASFHQLLGDIKAATCILRSDGG